MKTYIPNIRITDFDYELPKEKIALYPLDKRENSKLLFADLPKKKINHYHFSEIADLLDKNTLLVLNDTKVISARVKLYKKSGGAVELLLINPISHSFDPQVALAAKVSSSWKCIVGGRNVNEGTVLKGYHEGYRIEAEILRRESNEADVEFRWFPANFSFSQILTDYGTVPLPPYIKRSADENDKERYQTVYAGWDGSVAAPTAGLHFTPEILNDIEQKGISISRLTLHVGPGTFQPLSTEKVSEHKMHEERFFISADELNKLIEAAETERKIIPAGTTSLRTLESLYWIGAKILAGKKVPFDGSCSFEQWEAYKLAKQIDSLPSRLESLKAIADNLQIKGLAHFSAVTKLLIAPSYQFKMTDGLITNYHIPQSTLILLVAAFAGDDYWKEIYKTALDSNYRFLSYGDSSFLKNY